MYQQCHNYSSFLSLGRMPNLNYTDYPVECTTQPKAVEARLVARNFLNNYMSVIHALYRLKAGLFSKEKTRDCLNQLRAGVMRDIERVDQLGEVVNLHVRSHLKPSFRSLLLEIESLLGNNVTVFRYPTFPPS